MPAQPPQPSLNETAFLWQDVTNMSSKLAEPITVLTAVTHGDTWRGIPSITVKVNDTPLDLTGATAEMQLRRSPQHAELADSWSTQDSGIELTDPLAGLLAVNSRIITVPPANYYWGIRLTLASGRRITIAQGTWNILQSVNK